MDSTAKKSPGSCLQVGKHREGHKTPSPLPPYPHLLTLPALMVPSQQNTPRVAGSSPLCHWGPARLSFPAQPGTRQDAASLQGWPERL